MKLNELWIRQIVNPALTAVELAHQITMAGLEVDDVSPLIDVPLHNVVVGQVVDVQPHPDADRLKVTTVNAGGEPLQIVCGATNVVPGIKVPVALEGAKLPGGINIKKGKLRGVESFGMLCGAEEVGLASDVDGLHILSDHLTIGQSITDALALNDHVFDISITPNRADCLSMRGLAREIGVLNQMIPHFEQISPVPPALSDQPQISVEAPAASPRYSARIVRHINSQAPTPDWMKQRLERSGLRTHDLIVDVTNYVLLELGQPLHAFDLNKTGSSLIVRFAKAGEQIQLLNENMVDLTQDVLVIANQKEPLAIAGVMGGLNSAVDANTQDIILESAFFDPVTIAGRARRYGLHTDASARFERGVDFELPLQAIERATQLLVQYGGAEAGPVSLVESTDNLPKRKEITIDLNKIKQALGFEVESDFVESTLRSLGFSVSSLNQNQWTVTAPSWRFDVAIEADIVEEIARLYGYDNIPAQLPKQQMQLASPSSHLTTANLKQLLGDLGYQEVVSFSFCDPQTQNTLTGNQPALNLANPISSDLSAMRQTLLASMLPIVQYNLNRQQNRVRLFEEGLRFEVANGIPDAATVKQIPTLAILAAGNELPEQWQKEGDDSAVSRFYRFKQDIKNLLDATHQDVVWEVGEQPWLHPGQTAIIKLNNVPAGYVGRLHPAIEKNFDLPPTFMSELNMDALQQPYAVRAGMPPRFPSVKRDLAMVIKNTHSYAVVEKIARKHGGPFLQDVGIFDVYTGQGIESDARSLALSLLWQPTERTLEEDEIKAAFEAVIQGLHNDLGAVLR